MKRYRSSYEELLAREAAAKPPPPELDHETARAAMLRHGSATKAAKALGVARTTFRRALSRQSDAGFLPASILSMTDREVAEIADGLPAAVRATVKLEPAMNEREKANALREFVRRTHPGFSAASTEPAPLAEAAAMLAYPTRDELAADFESLARKIRTAR